MKTIKVLLVLLSARNLVQAREKASLVNYIFFLVIRITKNGGRDVHRFESLYKIILDSAPSISTIYMPAGRSVEVALPSYTSFPCILYIR